MTMMCQALRRLQAVTLFRCKRNLYPHRCPVFVAVVLIIADFMDYTLPYAVKAI